MSAKASTAQAETDGMYYCIKCDKNHRRDSMIGSWHERLELPQVRPSDSGLSKYKKLTLRAAAAGIAVDLARRERDQNEIKYSHYQQKWRELFDKGRFDGNPRDALYELRDDYRGIIVRRHTGHEWVALEASGDSDMMIKSLAKNYATLGMSFGVRHDL